MFNLNTLAAGWEGALLDPGSCKADVARSQVSSCLTQKHACHNALL
jgi:hypothetical protein